MTWRRLLTRVVKQQLENSSYANFIGLPPLSLNKVANSKGGAFGSIWARSQSSYVGSFAHRMRDADGASDTTLLNKLYRSDPETVIRLFESQPSLHSNPLALSEYIKALVKVNKLYGSQLLAELQKGVSKEELSDSVPAALKNVDQMIKNGPLGTAKASIHMVTAETASFKEQLWKTFRALALAFLLIFGAGALLENKGISKGFGLQEQVQPSMESNTKFGDVKVLLRRCWSLFQQLAIVRYY